MPRPRSRRASTEHELLRCYSRRRDIRTRDELVECFLPLARGLATRYSRDGELAEDLVQVACVGLLKAIDRYDPACGSRFTSYATPTILGELRRYFRDCGWVVHVPRDLQERALAVNRIADGLAAERGRSPTPQEVAAALGCALEDVVEALEAATCYRPMSLDEPIKDEADKGAALVDLVSTVDDVYEAVDYRDALIRLWPQLSELERTVLHLRFFEELSQAKIGERLGYSQMHVSRLVRRALARLQHAADGGRAAA